MEQNSRAYLHFFLNYIEKGGMWWWWGDPKKKTIKLLKYEKKIHIFRPSSQINDVIEVTQHSCGEVCVCVMIYHFQVI